MTRRPVRQARGRAAPPSGTEPRGYDRGMSVLRSRLDPHRERGKLPVRERIDRLIDPGSAFLELSPLAADGVYDPDDAPRAPGSSPASAASRAPCVIVANDATVKGGTYYPLTVKKHLRAQEIALENRLPCIYLVDSGRRVPAPPGRRLPGPRALRPDLLQPGPLSAAASPRSPWSWAQHGRRRLCPGDERRDGDRPGHRHDLPRRPAAGEGRHRRGRQRRGPGRRRRPCPDQSGVVDHEALDDEHALALGRSIVANLNRPAARRRPGIAGRPNRPPCRPTAAAGAHLYAAVPADLRRHSSPRGDRPARRRQPLPRVQAALRRDPGVRLRPPRRLPVGIIANDGILFSQSALKGAHFIELACPAQDPAVFLQNITGSWSAASTRPAGSPRTAPRWSWRWRAPRCPSSRSSSAAASAPATTRWPGGPTRRASCGPGRTAGSA
jgi:3-methylcrotonyl-CoA carboxylase beta subunit